MANMVSGFLAALQSAVLAIENEVGVTSARNYVRKDGAVTITQEFFDKQSAGWRSEQDGL